MEREGRWWGRKRREGGGRGRSLRGERGRDRRGTKGVERDGPRQGEIYAESRSRAIMRLSNLIFLSLSFRGREPGLARALPSPLSAPSFLLLILFPLFILLFHSLF